MTTEYTQNDSQLKNSGVSFDFIEAAHNQPYLASKFNMKSTPYEIGMDLNKQFPVIIDDVEASIGDTESVDPIIFYVNMNMKPVGSGVELSEGLIINSPEGLAEIKNKLPQRLLRKVQSQAFGQGTADGSGNTFQSIVHYNEWPEKPEAINEFSDMNAMFIEFASNPDNLQDAILVVNSLTDLHKFKDGDGSTIFKFGTAEDGRVGTFYGVPVFVQNMNGKANMVLMHAKAYGGPTTDFEANEIDDTHNNILKKDGGSGPVIYPSDGDDVIWTYTEGFMDARVLNPKAIKIYKAVPTKTVKKVKGA